MVTSETDIIPNIIEEHCDEASFLYRHRQRALTSHAQRPIQLARIEERLLAHLDGLVSGGESAWPLMQPLLAGPTRAHVLVAAWTACELPSELHMDELYAVLTDANMMIWLGIRDALRYAGGDQVEPRLLRWLHAAHWPLRAAAVDALSFRRVPVPPAEVAALCTDHSALVRACAAEAVGRLRLTAVGDLLPPLFDDADPHVQDNALCAAVLLGDPRALPHYRLLAQSGGARAAQAFTVLGRLGQRADVEALLGPELAKSEPSPAAVVALGTLGLAAELSRLLPLAGIRRYAGLVAATVERVTGVSLVEKGIAAPALPPADPKAELDDVAVEALPVPDPQRLADFLVGEQARLPAERLCMGEPYGAAPLLRLFNQGPLAQRSTAAYELALWSPGEPYREAQQLLRGGG